MEERRVTESQCQKNVKNMTDKIDNLDNKFTAFELTITKQLAEIPKKLADEFDIRYADKKTENTVDKVIWLIISSNIVMVLGIITCVGTLIALLK